MAELPDIVGHHARRTARWHPAEFAFWAIVIGFFAYVLVRALPTVNEYLTIQRAVEKIAASAPSTVPEARRAFDRQKDIEYSITAISGSDLEITKENDKVVIRYANLQKEL